MKSWEIESFLVGLNFYEVYFLTWFLTWFNQDGVHFRRDSALAGFAFKRDSCLTGLSFGGIQVRRNSILTGLKSGGIHFRRAYIDGIRTDGIFEGGILSYSLVKMLAKSKLVLKYVMYIVDTMWFNVRSCCFYCIFVCLLNQIGLVW